MSDDIVIPRPRALAWREGLMDYGPGAVIAGGEGLASRKAFLAFSERLFGFAPAPLPPGGEAGAEGCAILLRLDPRLPGGNEDYRLEAGPGGCRVEARAEAGLAWGLRSLEQLLFRFREGRHANLPALAIEDGPRFPWRGFMLDEARHFFGAVEAKRLIELAALHKLNVFHWHLTDDQGWRIESEAFPELTRVGSRRRETRGDGRPVEGFYTKAEIREIVAFAAERGVEVLPEIDLPGHVTALLASHPGLGCRGLPREVATRFGIFEDILCAGKDGTLRFLETLLAEVAELFPGRYLHLGGDEAPKARWEDCPDCQARIRTEGLSGTEELQAWLMNRLVAFLRASGKEVVAWNESVYSGRLDPGVVMQYWLEPKGAPRSVAAANAGRRSVLSPFFGYYLDYPHGMTPLRKTYGQPLGLPGMDATGMAGVLGVEAPLWTEYVEDRAGIDRRVFPRLCAVAEAGWSGSDRPKYEEFLGRLGPFSALLAWRGVGMEPLGGVDPSGFRAAFQVARHFLGAIDRHVAAFLLGQALRPLARAARRILRPLRARRGKEEGPPAPTP